MPESGRRAFDLHVWVGAGDPPTYALVCLVLGTVALLASHVQPAVR